MTRLKIQFVHRFFWPDSAPVAAILRAICETLEDEGHELSVLTSQPCYKPELEIPAEPKKQEIGSIKIRRISLPKEKRGARFRKLFNMMLFEFVAGLRVLFGPKKDVIVALSFPPVVNGCLFSWIAKLRGSDFYYHIMDIHPESSFYGGHMKDGLLYRIARGIDARTCRRAKRTIVLSKDMETTVRQRPGLENLDNIRVIANFNIPDYGDDDLKVPEQYRKDPSKFRLTFAGNIGNFQAIPNLVEAAKLLADHEHIEWVFLGEGAMKKKAIELAGDCLDKTIRFFPHQSAAVADAIMQESDLGIVSLSAGIIRFANPCKTSSYLSLGCPLLLVVEPDSGLYQTTLQSGIGIVCPPDDPQQLADAVLAASQNDEELEGMRTRSLEYAKNNLQRDVLLDKWRVLIKDYVNSN